MRVEFTKRKTDVEGEGERLVYDTVKEITYFKNALILSFGDGDGLDQDSVVVDGDELLILKVSHE